jgi:hypothetical protein
MHRAKYLSEFTNFAICKHILREYGGMPVEIVPRNTYPLVYIRHTVCYEGEVAVEDTDQHIIHTTLSSINIVASIMHRYRHVSLFVRSL